MVSLDYRTRREADIRPVDARAFFDHELPLLIAARADADVADVVNDLKTPMTFLTVDRERRVMYTGFRLPEDADSTDAATEAKLRRIREGAYKTVSQAPAG